jgi:very-short-patch-repair endonuclease
VLAAHLYAIGVPAPTRELVFAPPRRWRFDFAWEAARLAVEVEGGVWSRRAGAGGRHNRGAGYLADLAKYNAAALAGWTLLRYTDREIRAGEAAREIRRVLLERGVECPWQPA